MVTCFWGKVLLSEAGVKVGPLSGVGHRFLDRKGGLECFQLLTSMACISHEAKKRGSSLYWGWRKRVLHVSQRSGEEIYYLEQEEHWGIFPKAAKLGKVLS